MQITIPAGALAQGVVAPLSAASPAALRKLDRVCLLLKGHADLFLCQRTSEEEWGARHPFLRVTAGGALFPLMNSWPDLALLAVGGPGSEWLDLPVSIFGAHLADEAPWAMEALEQWIASVAGRLFVDDVPLSYLDVARTNRVEPAEQPQAVVTVEGVRWLRPRAGGGVPLGTESLGRVEAGCFPIARLLWMQTAPGSAFDVLSTGQAAKVDGFWSGLEAFHRAAGQLLLTSRDHAMAVGRARIEERSSFDRKLFENALASLKRAVQPVAGVVVDAKCNDALFKAMQSVASELGIRLVTPIELLQGRNLSDPIQTIAKASAVRVRRVALKAQWWSHIEDPLLCFAEGDRKPLAVLPGRFGRLNLRDESTGTTVCLTPEIAGRLEPIAYTLYRPFPRSALSIGMLLQFGLSRGRLELVMIVFLGMVTGLLAMVSPVAISVIFNRVIPGAERGELIQLTVLLLVVTFASSLFNYVRGLLVLRLQGKMDASLQAALWDRLLSLPVPFFREFSSGDLAQRSMGIAQIRDILTGSVVSAMLSGIFSVFSFGLLFYYSVHLALFATMLIGFAFMVSVLTGLAQVRFRRRYLLQSGVISNKLLQILSGISKFKVSGTESRAFSVWAADFGEQRKTSVTSRKIAIGLNVFNAVFPVICVGLIFLNNTRLGAGLMAPPMSTGNFLGFLAAFTQCLTAALAISATTADLASIVPTYERARPILQTLPEVTEGKSNPGHLSGRLELSNIRFSYGPDSPVILRDISLRVESGQSVAFVGASGCGKSTLLRLLLGFERPLTGSIYFDGQDLAGLDIQAVRRQIGVVLQSSKPVNGSIFDNIVGSAPLTIEDAWDACRLAGLDEDIRRMPMGLHTNISDGGGGISGGQRQRLMIARAIVAKPKIIIFDEATSALDNRTQAIVNRSLTGLQATRIIIAHRLSTIQHVDRIFVLDQGRIVESGSYDELVKAGGLFQQLVMRQMN